MPNAPKAAESAKAGIGSKPPETPKTSNPLAEAPKAPETKPSVKNEGSKAGQPTESSSQAGPPGLDSNQDVAKSFVGSGEVDGPGAKEMIAGTVANPKTMPLPEGIITAVALLRSTDGMWRAVRYKIQGNVVIEAKTKEPDLKAILAAQLTDCLALDMPLFNDEDGQRE